MITKSSSRRQILVSMSLDNMNKIMILFNKYITNINRTFKNIKLEVIADFIYTNNKDLFITTHKVVSNLDLNIIKSILRTLVLSTLKTSQPQDYLNQNHILRS